MVAVGANAQSDLDGISDADMAVPTTEQAEIEAATYDQEVKSSFAQGLESTDQEPPPPTIIDQSPTRGVPDVSLDETDGPMPSELQSARRATKKLKKKIQTTEIAVVEESYAVRQEKREVAKEVQKIVKLQNQLATKEKKLAKLRVQLHELQAKKALLKAKASKLTAKVKNTGAKIKRTVASHR